MSPRAGGGAFFSRAAAQKLALAAGRPGLLVRGALGTKVGGWRGARVRRGAFVGPAALRAGSAARGSLPRLTEGAAMPACEVSRLGEGAA